MTSISVQNISLNIGKKPILVDVSTDFSGPGSIVLFGPNGAGKSTLLKAITGIVQPQSGEVQLNGISIRKNREEALKLVGAHIEPGSFYSQLTGREILYFIEKMRMRKGGRSDVNSDSLIEKLGMTAYADDRIGTYSTGMRRKLSVAAAVVCAPPIILLDEPTDGLDPASSRRVRELIQFLHKDKECLIITTSHDIEGAESIATRSLVIIEGRIVFDSKFVDDRITIKLTVSNPNDFDGTNLDRYGFEMDGQILNIRGVEKHEVSDILREVVANLKVESVSLRSEFRQFYETYLTDSGNLYG